MKKILMLLCLVAAGSSFAQIKMQGVVKDSIGAPLELANVIAINQETNGLESYAVTNDQGKYVLSLGKNGKYKLQVSYIGLKSYEEVISTAEADITKDFTLMPDNSLDAVELTYEMPVTVKGDTIVYNADSFKNGSERKLEDVLEKLPGVEINDDGQIEVEGKTVSKLMVNGKDFFDGDTKLATKNIPSNAVDKVQVLRNYAEVGQLSGVQNNQDNVAINIKLKEGKENFWFGDITAGTGTAPSPNDELYLVQPKLFYYSPKYSINLIGDMNNIGEVALTNRDLRGFGGGFRMPSRTSGTSINLGDNGLGGLTSIANAQEVVTKLASANFSYSPNKALDLSGFLIFNSSRLRTREESFIDYIELEDDPSTTDIDESTTIPPDEETLSTGREATNQFIAKLSASYKPNVNNQLDYDVLARLSDDEERQNLFSSVVGNTNQLDEVKPFSINQNLNYYYTLNENNIFAFEAQHLIKDEDPFYNALLQNDPNNNDDEDNDAFDDTASGLGLDLDQLSYDLNQERRVKSNQLDAKVDYFNILNSKSNINFTLGTIFSNQKFNSNIFQFLDDGTILDPTPTITNEGELLTAENDNVEYRFSDVYLGVHYRFKTGKFTFTPGVSFHAYSNQNTQNGDTFKDNFLNVLPDFEARVQFKKSESLQFNYNMTNTFTDITNIAEGLVLNNYNSIQFGNPELQNALSHNFRLFYSSFNLFNYTNVFAGANYSKNEDQIRGLTNFESVIRTSTFFNSQFADESASVFGRVERTFGKFRARMGANFNYSKLNQFVQGAQSLNESFTQSYSPELRTNFREAPNVRLRYRYTVRDNEQGDNTTKFITRAPSVEFDAYIWDALSFVTEFTYNEQESDGQTQVFKTWDASLRYRKDRDTKWEYSLRASNILDIDSNISNGAGTISVFSSETFIQPRFITFRLTYTL
ncbi:carboxypeptidase regulatory-like domain-containing protein [Winogradskyella marincola]|uniref:Outer membrane beta-barrel protein n=1 Tax=Winogradskyella marincola TaxID=3037795 RepID=A0ABT6G1V1_9FLAO|nr:carboxypeptidase regulatory-like domain-containing protein [Winogradskyella sp. YYF002]MDG4715829.1 outer membrane beta-barrel protein [Winogradskyella sp. YYF002]